MFIRNKIYGEVEALVKAWVNYDEFIMMPASDNSGARKICCTSAELAAIKVYQILKIPDRITQN